MVEFESVKVDRSAKGKGKMVERAHAYRRSPLSSINVDFTSFTSTTATSTFDREYDREQGSSSRGNVVPALEDLVQLPENRPESSGNTEPMSPTTPLSADPLMRDWHSTTISPTSPG